MKHILIGRRAADGASPHMFGRYDWDGQRWGTADLVLDRGAHGASSVQHNVHALVAAAIGDIGRGADLTLTYRCVSDLINFVPGVFDVPFDSSAVILCPLHEGEPADAQIWTQVLVNPGSQNPVMVLPDADQRFVKKRLDVAVKAILTKSDLDERCLLHCKRELWVRRGVSAELMAPAQVKARPVAPPDPVLVQAEEQMAARQVRAAATARGKITAKRSTDAIEFNKKSAAKFAKEQATRRAREPRAK